MSSLGSPSAAAAPLRFRPAPLPAVIVSILLLLLGHLELPAQTRSEKTLLWEISGNGRPRPSYLYGTMHLQDSRVFDLADSVLIALKRCAVFAPEADLDSLAPAIFRMVFDGDTTSDLQLLLTPERYQALDSELQATLGIPVEQVRHMKPWMIPFLRQQESGEKDEATFLDAWLSRVARLEGLRLEGLESVGEHLATFESLPLESAEEFFGSADSGEDLERLITAYAEADLDSIAGMIGAELSDTVMRVVLTDRNHRMAARIESISRAEPVFAAVGAAHLVGPEGLIELLRARGFTVRPVKVTRTGYARAYTPPDRVLPWRSVVDSARGFALELPVEPVDLPLNVVGGMRMSMAVDFGSGIYYNVISMELPELADADMESMLDMMIKGMLDKKGSAVLSQRPVKIEGGVGREVVMKLDAGRGGETRSRMRVLARDGRLYMLNASTAATKGTPPDVERFFSSFKLIGLPAASEPDDSGDWGEVLDARGAFAVTMPLDTERQSMSIPSENGPFAATLISAKSMGTEYVILFGDLNGDAVLLDDAASFAGSLDKGLRRFEGMEREVRQTTVQGFPAQDVTVWMPGGGSAHMRTLMRGNRMLSMIAGVRAGGDTTAAVRFLESIRFLDPVDKGWRRARIDSLGFSAEFPADPVVEVVDIDDDDDDPAAGEIACHNVYARDPGSGLVYNVVTLGFDRYYTARLDTGALFAAFLQPFMEEGDSLISERRFLLGRSPAEDLVIRRSKGHALYRMRSILNGTRYFRVILLAPESMLHAPQAERFFASVRPLDTMFGTSIFVNKLPLLLRDAASSDPAVRAAAVERIPYADAEPGDVPAIIAALRSPLPDDASEKGTRRELLWKLYMVADDTTTPGIAAAVTGLLPKLMGTPAVESAALRTLLLLGTPEACDAASKRLLDGPRPAELLTDDLIAALLSNPGCLGERAPELFAHIGRTPSRAGLIRLAAEDLVDSVATLEAMKPYIPRLMELSEKVLSDTHAATDSAAVEAATRVRFDVVALLEQIPPSDPGRALVRALLADADASIRRAALTPAFLYGEKIPDGLIAELAADPIQRLTLFGQLATMDRVSLMPQRYRTGASLVEGSALSVIGSMIDSLSLAGETARAIGGREGRFYIFKITKEGESRPMVVGPVFDVTMFDIAGASTWYGDEEFDRDSLDGYVKSAIESAAAESADDSAEE